MLQNDNLLRVKSEYADDPMNNTEYIVPASKAAEMYPGFASQIMHPEFSHLSYTICEYRFTIEWVADNEYDDGIEPEPWTEEELANLPF